MVGNRGQALAEYGLAGGCVLVVSIVALNQIGSFLNTSFSGLMSNKAGAYKVAGAATGSESTTSAETNIIVKPSITPQSILDTNSTPMSPTTLINSVVTTGANGTTNILADRLGTEASLLLAEGKIDQNQYNTLFALANQGHKLAQIEGLIQQLTQSSTNSTQLNSQTVLLDGKSVTVADLNALIGYKDNYWGITANPLNSNIPTGPELHSFISLYQSALSNGSLSDPATRQVVAQLSEDIATINEGVTEGLDTIYRNGASPSQISANIADRVTDMKSSQICNSGGGVDFGVQCGP